MSSLGTYDIGETVYLKATFANEAGTPTNQATVTLHIERPDGTVETKTTPDVTNPAAGVYEYQDTVTARGRTYFCFQGATGGVTVIEQGYYVGRTRRAAP